ncbi:hypothetical protein [Teredinibacter turnerae]|uniref:hypothetical protein n=1 Tax=Teredinibacter turnerae TaxID=2426 RepID=UPI00041D0F77|nr:hypothetical protein [Teredinibacter turnerae]
MPTYFFSPDDFTPDQARVILGYLNSTDDPAVIASRIELENELDIGVGLAKRIIQQRKQLGGTFSTLQQVYDVPYIGPERFTEIAVALLGLSPGGDEPLTLPADDQLNSEIAQLRQQLARLEQLVTQAQSSRPTAGTPAPAASQRIALRVLQRDVFLGQHVTIEIYAYNEQTGQALADQPVTVTTNWGVLQYQQGYSRYQDAVVEVRTDIAGKAKIKLRSPTFETLTQEQQLALEAALLQLDATAPTPAAIREQLQSLVLNYRLENNLHLRKAVDIYFNAQKTALVESVNRRYFSDNWQFHHALVCAYLHEPASMHDLGMESGAGNGRVATLSTVKVRLKNWVGAWYQTYLEFLENGNQFSERVKNLSANVADGGRLINGVLSEMSRWTLGERGIAGSVIGEKSTELVVHKFLAEDIQDLPTQQQLQLYSALSVAVRPSAVTQVGTLQAVADTQLVLTEEISARFDGVEDLGVLTQDLRDRIDGFDLHYGEFQTRLDQFNSNYASFNNQRAQFNSDLTNFNSQYATFNADYSSFNNDYSNFNNTYLEFDADYANFAVNYNSFNTGLADFNTKYSGLDMRMTTIDAQLSSVNTTVAGVTTDLGDLRNNVQRIDARIIGPR